MNTNKIVNRLKKQVDEDKSSLEKLWEDKKKDNDLLVSGYFRENNSISAISDLMKITFNYLNFYSGKLDESLSLIITECDRNAFEYLFSPLEQKLLRDIFIQVPEIALKTFSPDFITLKIFEKLHCFTSEETPSSFCGLKKIKYGNDCKMRRRVVFHYKGKLHYNIIYSLKGEKEEEDTILIKKVSLQEKESGLGYNCSIQTPWNLLKDPKYSDREKLVNSDFDSLNGFLKENYSKCKGSINFCEENIKKIINYNYKKNKEETLTEPSNVNLKIEPSMG